LVEHELRRRILDETGLPYLLCNLIQVGAYPATGTQTRALRVRLRLRSRIIRGALASADW
jgi:hypothetical protein